MKYTNITQQSTKWEIKNSLYILFSLFGAGYAAFFYIGRKTKQRKWVITGCILAVITIVMLAAYLYLDSFIFRYIQWQYNLEHIIIPLYWIATIFYSFLVRREYLLRLEALQTIGADETAELKKRIKNEYRLDSTPEVNTGSHNTEQDTHILSEYINKNPVANTTTSIDVIDINTCSESDFEKLPGISSVLAKKLIDYRNANGGFKDEDEFFSVAALKPHFVVQIRDKITCSNYPYVNSAKKPHRKLDL